MEGKKSERVGVRCERQIVGAHVVEVAQVPGALLFHGSHSLSVKTAQPCRQLCSGGCGGERKEERGEERTFVFHFAPHLHQRPESSRLVVYPSHPDFLALPCLFSSSAKVQQKKQKPRFSVQQPRHYLHMFFLLFFFASAFVSQVKQCRL